MTKKEIRKRILDIRKNLDKKIVESSGRKLLEELMKNKITENVKSIFIYVSAKNEVSTYDTIRYLFERDIKVCVPKTYSDGRMDAVEIESFGDLEEGRFGLLEPVSSEVFPLEDIDVAIVPGVAFDLNGNRIGYGGGFYDRFFERCSGHDMKKIGTAYDFQITELPEPEKSDIKMDRVLTIKTDCFY